MDPTSAVLAFLGVFCLSATATVGVLALLRRRRILDRPNERSSHARPTPRGGGIAVIGVLLPAWAVFAWFGPKFGGPDPWLVLAGAAGLAAVSWIDDLRGLPPLPRFAAQAAAVAAGVWALAGAGPVFQGWLPAWLDLLCAGLLWLWFINLFNFMDGIDGLAGVETMSLGLGLFLLSAFGGLDPGLGGPALLVAAAAFGFLVWNWPPAKLFLGDVGSVPLGFVLGWLLLGAAADGYWAAALILPLYYLSDASWTLARRLARGDRVWRAHREHFYQRAVRGGLSHARVAGAVLVANAALVVLAIAAAWDQTWPALAGAAAVVAALLWHLGRRRGTGSETAP